MSRCHLPCIWCCFLPQCQFWCSVGRESRLSNLARKLLASFYAKQQKLSDIIGNKCPILFRLVRIPSRLATSGHMMVYVRGKGETKIAYIMLGVKPERKRLLWRTTSYGRWEVTVTVDLQETGCEDVGWIHLLRMLSYWRALVNTVGVFGFRKLRSVSWSGSFNDAIDKWKTASVV